jgi:hypothetical protein
MMTRVSGWAAIGAAALLIAGGGGYALASGASNTIAVCVRHKGGALYEARKCAKHDQKLIWNARGPQGIQGATGGQGAQGAQGLQGDRGLPGPAGPITGIAPSGVTMTGMYDIEGYEEAGEAFGGAISFPLTLSSAPTAVVEVPWEQTNPDPTHCAGSPDAPTAAAGYLCIYDRYAVNVTPYLSCSAVCTQDLEADEPAANVFGARLLSRATATGYARVEGSWAVTAP